MALSNRTFAAALRRTAVLPLATLLLSAAACKNTADGAKQDTEIAAEKTVEAGEEVGTAMGGGAKTVDVKAALMADSLVTGTEINVDTNDDTKTVTLSGNVKSDAIRARAEQVAKDNATGYSVVNNLTVRTP